MNPPDTIEVLLDLIEGHCDDFLVANGIKNDPIVPPWYALGYWRDYRDATCDGEWEIDVRGNTLRECLTAFIADARFGQ